jgi:hypothetical protein
MGLATTPDQADRPRRSSLASCLAVGRKEPARLVVGGGSPPEGRTLACPRGRVREATSTTLVTRADAARGVLELMAASRLEPQLDELFDAPRHDTIPPAAAVTVRPTLTALTAGRRHSPAAPADSHPVPLTR